MANAITLTYLRDRTLHQVEIDEQRQVASHVEWEFPTPVDGTVEFVDLSCFKGNSFLLAMARVSKTNLRSLRSIVIADLKHRRLDFLVEESDRIFLSPIVSPDGQRVAMFERYRSGMDGAITVRSASGKELLSIKSPGISAPRAWASNGEKIYLTQQVDSSIRSNVAEVDIASGSITSLFEGFDPKVNPVSGAIAYVSEDRSEIRIHPQLKSGTRSAHGFFKGLVGWLNDREILAITGVRYTDSFVFASMSHGSTDVISVPGRGEIRGACLLQ